MRAPALRLPALRALCPLIFIIRPQPCSFRKGMAARAHRKAPTYLTSKSLRRSFSSTISMGPAAVVEPPGRAALLTRMCSPPSFSFATATARSTCSRLVTSRVKGITRRPVSSSSSRAVLSSSGKVRAAITTSTPSRANSRAMDLPMPRPPPTTIACLPCKLKSM